ncbi:hypothetical protein BH23PLA1_BH23PLA1_36120 [soil metagenome]
MFARAFRFVSLAPLTLGLVFAFTGCEQPGPAEQAGESIDQGIDNVGDTLSPSGPAEETGESIDDAFDNN